MQSHLLSCLFLIFLGFKTCCGFTDEDRKNHVKRKCEELNLPYYKVAYKHYCCGCAAGQYVYGDCEVNVQYTTQCKTCPFDASNRTFTSEANTQKWCNIAKSPTYCLDFMNTKFVEGSSNMDASCQCIPGTFALYPEKDGCAQHRVCPPMFFLSRQGNSTHDVHCTRCPTNLCTYEYSNTQACQPCAASNQSFAHIPQSTTTTVKISPSRPSEETQTPQSLPKWVIPTIVVASILGIVIGVVFKWQYDKCQQQIKQCHEDSSGPEGDSLLSNPQDVPDGTQTQQSPSSGGSSNSLSSGRGSCATDNLSQAPVGTPAISGTRMTRSNPPPITGDTPQQSATNNNNTGTERIEMTPLHGSKKSEKYCVVNIPETSDKAFAAEEGQAQQAGGCVADKPGAFDEAGTHDTNEVPMKGPAILMDRDRYTEMFLKKGYRIAFEPNIGFNCLLAAILAAIEPSLYYPDLERKASSLRDDLVQYLTVNMPDQLRSSIQCARFSEAGYIRKLRDNSRSCDEIALEAVALMKDLIVHLIYTGGPLKTFHGSTNDKSRVLYIGNVERDYFVVLKPSHERRDGDPEASSNAVPFGDSRLEPHVTRDGAGPSATTNSSRSRTQLLAHEGTVTESGCQSVPNYTKPPEQLRVKSDWDLFDDRDQKSLMGYMQKDPKLDVSACLDNVDLAKAMLKGDPPLLPQLDPLVVLGDDNVTSLVRLPSLIKNANVLLNDAKNESTSPQDKRYRIVDRVIDELGMRLTPRLLLKSAKLGREKALQRFFTDRLFLFLDRKCSGPSQNGSSNS